MTDYKRINSGDFAKRNKRITPNEFVAFFAAFILTLGVVWLVVHFANWIDTVKVFA